MKFKSIIKNSVIIIFTTTSIFAFAEEIPCPSADIIKNSWRKLNTIQILPGKIYLAFSDFPCVYDENSRLWQIVSAHVSTFDFNSAFEMSISNIRNAMTQKEPFARNTSYGYVCGYRNSAGNDTAYTILDKNSDSNKIKNTILSLQVGY